MHEITIAKNILKQAERYGNVTRLVVECGELAHIPAKDLEKALKDISKSEISVTESPSTVKCGCGFKGRPRIELHSHDATIFFCPECGEVPKIKEGNGIMIKSVTVEKR